VLETDKKATLKKKVLHLKKKATFTYIFQVRDSFQGRY
jgi:hypothetical protein